MTGHPWITACVCLWSLEGLLGLLAAPIHRTPTSGRTGQ